MNGGYRLSVCMGKQKAALFVCAFGQLGAVVCVEDYVFVYMSAAVWNCKMKKESCVCVCADEHETQAVMSVSPQPPSLADTGRRDARMTGRKQDVFAKLEMLTERNPVK